MPRDRAEALIPEEVLRRTLVGTSHPTHGQTRHEIVQFRVPAAGSWTWTVVIVYTDNQLTYTTARAVSRLPWVREDPHEIQLERIRENAGANGATYRVVADEWTG